TPHMDVAILQMESCGDIPAARIGDSNLVRTGDETYVVGNPFGRNPDSVSRGIISHTERFLSAPAAYFQTDAAVNPGNSGGALFNRSGTVIGLTTAIANNKSKSNVGIGYALPINEVANVVADLRVGPPSWGDAGIKGHLAALTAEEAAIFNVQGGGAAVSVMKSPEAGPSANLIFERDVIYAIDGVNVANPSHIHRMISTKNPGDTVEFSIIRNGAFAAIDVTLTDGWNAANHISREAESYPGLLGMKVEMWSEYNEIRGRYDSPVITKIHSMGPAHRSYLVSSQSSVRVRGPAVIPIQLSVRTITGVVLEGEYQPIHDIDTLDAIATEAYESNRALLLEIESWGRNPKNMDEPLRKSTSAFYRIVPQPGPGQTVEGGHPHVPHHHAHSAKESLRVDHRS
ncbi:MAG: trypsin-like peptidase domain-containing protein, partial [Pseudomonadota bacterium]